jgi:UDP-N-acetylmuramate--alanine ligase
LRYLTGRVHIVGIGGAGMSGIARVLLSRGIEVSGSDAKDSRRLQALKPLGGKVFVGHDANNIVVSETEPSCVVISTAIQRY